MPLAPAGPPAKPAFCAASRLVELPTAWFVVFRLNLHILLYFYPFMRLALSNKTGLFGLIWLYSGLFAAIYWTTETIDTPSHESG
jgi:hypothetical protein